MEEFDKTFGPDLKSVTGDHEQVDEILCRVGKLALPIEEVDFNPFDISNLSSWKTIMHDFNVALKVGLRIYKCDFFLRLPIFNDYRVSDQVIEDEAISIIDQLFKTLRSSTAAFKMLLKFKHVHSREAINKHLMRKFSDVLVQYCKEVPCCENRTDLCTVHACIYQLLFIYQLFEL